jgi:hypothetical protein
MYTRHDLFPNQKRQASSFGAEAQTEKTDHFKETLFARIARHLLEVSNSNYALHFHINDNILIFHELK